MMSFCVWGGAMKLLYARDLGLVWDLVVVAELERTLGGTWWLEAACDY
jgi:hypothetical protein